MQDVFFILDYRNDKRQKNTDRQPVEYVFSVTEGTLAWEEHGLNKPHYSLLFETEKYPAKPDTYYTATVKYGSQILGSTKFMSGH